MNVFTGSTKEIAEIYRGLAEIQGRLKRLEQESYIRYHPKFVYPDLGRSDCATLIGPRDAIGAILDHLGVKLVPVEAVPASVKVVEK